MNKVYNTVWNESTGMWVVTSELTRKGGRRPRQIRRTALAGLIISLFLPLQPALAIDYNNQALAGGSGNSTMKVQDNDTATNTTINKGGSQSIYNNAVVTDTTINNGGIQNVYGDGSHITNTTINNKGTQYVFADSDVTNTIINSGGDQSVYYTGHATNTTVNDGGIQEVYSDGSVTSTTVNSGGNQYIYDSGSASDTTINSGGSQNIYDDSNASDTIINSGGSQNIYDGGSASGTTINSDGFQYISSGGSASDTTINSGGSQNIYDGGNASDTTINSDGFQYISSGGNALNTTISGGSQYILDGGNAISTNIKATGSQYVSGGGSASDTVISDGGSQHVYAGGSATNTRINTGGSLSVYDGGVTTNTIINNDGYQHIYSGGSAISTTINNGGMLSVENGGSATQIVQNTSGAIVASTRTTLNGTNANGNFSIADGNASNMLLENGGYLWVLSGHQASDTTVGDNGELGVGSGGVLRGTTTLLDNSLLAGSAVINEGNLYYLNNNTADFTGSLTGSGSLTQEGGNTRFSGTLSQDGGITLKSGGAMTMDALQAITDVTAQSGTALTLDNGTILTGHITGDNTGTGDVTVKGASVWNLDGDASVGALTLDNGTIDFHPSAISRQASTFQPVSLTLNTLSGNGLFRMNTDIASHTGDMLKVTGNASGNFVLDIKNTGLEPVSAGTPLQVVQTGGGNAVFTLNGGKVDAGTWEYGLSKENTDWYLKADVNQPGADTPGTDNPGTGTPLPPVRQTTKSADAVLNMATAPAYIFNSELENLRLRHGDFMQNTRSPGGVWGRYLGSDNRISGGAGSGYSLSQNGFETGGDKAFDLGDSSLALGAFVSYTDNRISHNRGGNSTTGSTGGGLYATWSDNNGYYLDGVLKYNRFSNKLHTWMSDGTAVKGDYSQNGFGGSLEAGKTFILNETIWTQPYIRTTAFRADGKDISLNNGMKASIQAMKSVQAEAGVNLGMNLDVAGKTVRPYLKAAISHEFSDNNRVRINGQYGFTNDISGTTGTYGAGVNVQLTPNAGIWAEARYQKGEKTESPVTGSVGFRINF